MRIERVVLGVASRRRMRGAGRLLRSAAGGGMTREWASGASGPDGSETVAGVSDWRRVAAIWGGRQTAGLVELADGDVVRSKNAVGKLIGVGFAVDVAGAMAVGDVGRWEDAVGRLFGVWTPVGVAGAVRGTVRLDGVMGELAETWGWSRPAGAWRGMGACYAA